MKISNLKNIKPQYLNPWSTPATRLRAVRLLADDRRLQRRKMRELGLPTDTWAVIFDPQTLRSSSARSRYSIPSASCSPPRSSTWVLVTKPTSEAQAGARPDPARQAVLGGVQCGVLLQGADGRQHLAAHGYSNDFFTAQQDARTRAASSRSGYSIPKEGAVFALDNLVMTNRASARSRLSVHRLWLEGRASAELTNAIAPAARPGGDAAQSIRKSPRTKRFSQRGEVQAA